MKRSTEVAVALAVVGLVAGACNKRYGDLSEQPRENGGTGGLGGVGGGGGSGGRARGGSSGSGPVGGTTNKPTEPRGRSVTSFFHGIVDAERIAFCFARSGEPDPVVVGEPQPPGGLDYASSFALETIEGIDLDDTPVLPFVIAGELDLIDGMDCDEAVETARDEMNAAARTALGEGGGEGGAGGAGGEPGAAGSGGAPEPPAPPRLRVAALPEIPAPALAQGYSSLYVARGCIGGAAFTHALEEDVCGSGYSPDSSTASAVLVTLSRTVAIGKLALQAVHASVSAPTVTVLSAPPDAAVQPSVTVVYDLRRGAVQPRQPMPTLTPTDYGVNSPGWRAQASSNGNTLISERWVDVLDRAGLESFEADRGYTLVVVGPAGVPTSRGFWNAGAIGVVENDPES